MQLPSALLLKYLSLEIFYILLTWPCCKKYIIQCTSLLILTKYMLQKQDEIKHKQSLWYLWTAKLQRHFKFNIGKSFISASCSIDFLVLPAICTNNLSIIVIVSDSFNATQISLLKELVPCPGWHITRDGLFRPTASADFEKTIQHG